MKWYLTVLRKYADFSGRARRMEYWMFTLINFLIGVVLSFIDMALGSKVGALEGYGIISLVYFLAVFIPGLAVTVRRLHDIGKSGWFFLIVFIPLIGFIWLLVLLFTEGTRGPNKYGEDPKGLDPLQVDFA